LQHTVTNHLPEKVSGYLVGRRESGWA